MSRTSTSLELSEFFNNDDSDGHRLAEFLQKRRGGVQRQNFLFMNCEPQRISLNVQLEKIPPSQEKQELQQENCETSNKEQKDVLESDNRETNDANCAEVSVEKQMAALHDDTDGLLSSPCPKNVENCKETSAPSNVVSRGKPVSPISPVRPQSPLTIESASKKPLSPSRPLSPRLSAIRKSGGAISPGDRLRRYSLKRLSKIGSVGRRTLLQEFESTVSDSNFEPPICSTPLSQPQPDKPPSSPTTSHSPESQNSNTSGTEKSPATRSDSCCGHTDTLIRTLQRKDEELKNYMESILENTLKQIHSQEKENQKSVAATMNTNRTLNATKSPLKRTYTVERGNTPGQVILTPDKTVTDENPRQGKLLRSQTEPSSSSGIKLKTPERKLTRSMISIRVKSPNNLISPNNRVNNSIYHKENQSNINNSHITHGDVEMPEYSKTQFKVPNTPPPQNNVSIVFQTQDVEIPETQDLPTTNANSIVIQSDNREIPVVVIPVNQNFNKTHGEEKSNNTIITARTKKSINNTKTLEATKINDEAQLAEDNLKLTDILTEDEEETPKAAATRTLENNSQAPLNLAPSATNIRTKRLRKRSISRRKLQMDNSQLLSTETETEPPPPAHCSRRVIKKKRIPLNRAPGTPLNGERFAQELARMSNYEILDLRKRNSLGRVFAISGRKSTRAQEEAVKKQHQLEGQIEMELLRRNIDDTQQDQRHTENNETSKEEEEEERPKLIEEFPPVPDEFRDSLAKRYSKESSLVDEKSTDRISFKNKKNNSKHQMNKRSSRSKEKPMPEVLKQYLEVSKLITQHKMQKSFNKSKRSLYTQGQSDSEEQESSKQIATIKETRSTYRNNRSIPYLPSPPKSDGEQITIPKVVSPPPPLNITTRKSLRTKEIIEQSLHTTIDENNIEVLPPPPSGFESDSGVSSNNFNIHSSTNTKNTNKTDTSNTPQIPHTSDTTDDGNDNVFKKPLQPAPKRRGRKKNEILSNEVLQRTTTTSDSQQSNNDNSSATDTTDSSLRRSKRGQMPVKTSIFQLLYQQNFNKRLQKMERNMKKTRQVSKSKKTSDENNTIKSLAKNTDETKKQTQLATLPEDNVYEAELRKDIDILNKKAPKIKESKVNRKQKKINKKKTEKEQFECSRITMATPPPVDHLNNVFDQLRNTSYIQTQTATSPPTTSPLPQTSSTTVQKVKPFKVRVARLKTSTQTSSKLDSASVCSSTTNSNYELISWLKNITESSDNSTARNEEIFKEMRISPASNLSFTELQGVEYAFYDTDEKASLGYLRFKPRQIKSKKKAKRFHLHFVTLVGNFRITANDKESRVGVGDMVAIEKSVYYDIENITDDIGILMVVKK